MNKIDDVVLALLYLGLDDGARAWKGLDSDAINRLPSQGISIRTLERATAELGVRSEQRREDGRNVWYWALAAA